MLESILGGKVLLHCGDVLAVLRTLPSDHFHCVVTSPPYWGLRDYGVDGQMGLEQSLGEHVAAMTEVFREVRRVLRPDGTLWLNYGDSYATSVNGRSAADTKAAGNDDRTFRDKPFSTIGDGLKPKDLCGMPWRVALALQADGWYLRSDIIWSKLNPMPESITDRPTRSHEYMFLLAKSERYFYDAEAIKEPMKEISLQRLSQPNVLNQLGGPKDAKTGNRSHRKAINNQAERLIKHEKWKTRFEGWDQYDKSLGRNRRTVWEIGIAPFPEAHFATFPPALVEPCILAGCPIGGEVLDPFGGAGTTALVAASLGRRTTLIELNPEYCNLAKTRIEAAYMGADEGKRHMAKQLGKTEDPGPLFAGVEYDASDDMRKSIELGFKVIRDRIAAGGEPWVPKSTDGSE